jgi:hypothetical protein
MLKLFFFKKKKEFNSFHLPKFKSNLYIYFSNFTKIKKKNIRNIFLKKRN